MLGSTEPAAVATAQGLLHVEVARGSNRNLLAFTPVGAEWLVRALPRQLLEFFSVHIVELPGTGRSEQREGPITVDTELDAIVGVVEATEEPCFVFGHSISGLLVLAASARRTSQGVIAVGAPPALPVDDAERSSYWETKAEPERRHRADALQATAKGTESDEEVRRLGAEFDRLLRWHDLAFDSAYLDEVGAVPPGRTQAIYASGESYPWAEVIPSLPCPVMLALGEYDFLVPPTLWNPAVLPPRAKVEVFARSGHTPFVEEPNLFVEAVASWLATID